MAVAQRVAKKRKYAELLDFFSPEDVRNNLTFLMLIDHLLNKEMKKNDDNIIKITDPQDETNVLYYTNEKFIEIIEKYGLEGFIY